MNGTFRFSEIWDGDIELFLIGGPAYSGTTLLAFLLNQGKVICLDEPDFHDPNQSHRGIPFLKELFPHRHFPERTDEELSYREAVNLIQICEQIIHPYSLGFKTCNKMFIDYAEIYKALGCPVIAIIRDIRDALVNPLPMWLTEQGLNARFRLIWDHLNIFDYWLRYEDLIRNSQNAMEEISQILSHDLRVKNSWDPDSVHRTMFKDRRHDLLKSGRLNSSRIGIWRTSGKNFSEETHETAKMMGY